MSASKPLRVLAVHGVGDHHTDRSWTTTWRDAIQPAICRWDPERDVQIDFVSYDDLFESAEPDAGSLMSWLWTLLGSEFPRWFGRRQAMGHYLERARYELRWTAGMVVQWMRDEHLRESARKRILKRIEQSQADMICAHSLGSLVCYDALARPRASGEPWPLVFISFGSQIGNACVARKFPDQRATALAVRHWYHAYNRHDDIFTARVRISADNFTEVDTPFNRPGVGDHAAAAYLAHAVMSEEVWRPLLEPGRLARTEVDLRESA